MKRFIQILLIITLYSPCLLIAVGLPSGDEIAHNINVRNEGVAVARNLSMSMTDRRGKMRSREARASRKYYGEEKHTVIFYLEPDNVKGTAFLTWDYTDVNKDDDQWLYLPAMRKVRRISTSDRGDAFLGTDLTYEDIKREPRVSMQDYSRKTIGKDDVYHAIYNATCFDFTYIRLALVSVPQTSSNGFTEQC